MNPTRLFLYGTLKRGLSNHSLLRRQRFIAEAQTAPQFRLVDVGGFPALVKVDSNPLSVQGEVWEVDLDCLIRLDRFEGLHVGLYTRQKVQLLPPFENDHVEAYFYLGPTQGLPDRGANWTENGPK